MAIRKSDLYASLWDSADALRGGMDASQYKDYVLSLLFFKYVSDKYGDGQGDLTIEPEHTFAAVAQHANKPGIGDRINKAIRHIFENNNFPHDIVDVDFEDASKLGQGKDRIDTLSQLIAIFQRPELNFKRNRADGDDLLGDAYEYLMRHFATESGKSKGQFYTPAEVSRIMARVIGIRHSKSGRETLYDPTCGSGSLLIRAADDAPYGVAIYGQEYDSPTRGLAVMNMILHKHPTAEIAQGNTLASPHFIEYDELKRFDYVVANPPFSSKKWTSGLDLPHDQPYRRFEGYGIPPPKNGDYAFLLHVLKSMKDRGKGAIILPHGVLFRGNKEATIRQNLLERGMIGGIIGLPPNLFYGTSIPACIIVLDKAGARPDRPVFLVDASKGFVKDGPKNRLREQDIHKIVDTFETQREEERYSRLVPLAEIEANGWNLNLPRYIDSSPPEDIHDLGAHLLGGIPERDVDLFARHWQVLPNLRESLYAPSDRPGYLRPLVEPRALKQHIVQHPDFVAYRQRELEHFHAWWAQVEPAFRGINADTKPKEWISYVSERLLSHFQAAELVDPYDVYQVLMEYWAETLQDDVYQLVESGWLAARTLEPIAKGEKKTPDLVVGKLKLEAPMLPPSIVVAAYLAEQQALVDATATQLAEAEQALKELEEDYGEGEEDWLSEGRGAKGELTAQALKARLKELNKAGDLDKEFVVLSAAKEHIEKANHLKKQLKEAEQVLAQATQAQYHLLSEPECRKLLVIQKWKLALEQGISLLVDRESQKLYGRLSNLEVRYESDFYSLDDSFHYIKSRVMENISTLNSMEVISAEARLLAYSEQWKDVSLSEIATCLSSLSLARHQLNPDTGAAYIHYGDVHSWSSSTMRIDHSYPIKCDIDLAKSYSWIETGDIIMVDASEDYDGVGKSVVINVADNVRAVAGLHTILIRPNKTIVNPHFLVYLQNQSYFKNQLIKGVTGTSVLGLSKTALLSMVVRLPPLEEQNKIVNMVKAIEKLNITIREMEVKSVGIQNALRNELLIGKTRLYEQEPSLFRP